MQSLTINKKFSNEGLVSLTDSVQMYTKALLLKVKIIEIKSKEITVQNFHKSLY